MQPASPRKSSTSSGNRFDRPRYLLVEVVGAPTLSPRGLEALLHHHLVTAGTPFRFRVVRTEGTHGLVAVAHVDVAAARLAWNRPSEGGRAAVRTLRSYGTLRKGKAWIARDRRE